LKSQLTGIFIDTTAKDGKLTTMPDGHEGFDPFGPG
jgi:hypothetical protein